jgi:centrin-3
MAVGGLLFYRISTYISLLAHPTSLRIASTPLPFPCPFACEQEASRPTLTEEQRTEIREAFDVFDAAKSGSID